MPRQQPGNVARASTCTVCPVTWSFVEHVCRAQICCCRYVTYFSFIGVDELMRPLCC